MSDLKKEFNDFVINYKEHIARLRDQLHCFKHSFSYQKDIQYLNNFLEYYEAVNILQCERVYYYFVNSRENSLLYEICNCSFIFNKFSDTSTKLFVIYTILKRKYTCKHYINQSNEE